MSQNYRQRPEGKRPLFWHQILNNKMVTSLMLILLVLIIIFVFTKIAYLFAPISALFELFGFPIVASAILFYLFSPLVNQLSNRGVSKSAIVWGIFAFLILAISLSIGAIIPIIRRQVMLFIENIPQYYEALQAMVANLPFSSNSAVQYLSQTMNQFLENLSIENISQRLNPIVSSTFGGLGSIVATVTSAFAGLLTIPIITYYLLVEADSIPKKIIYFVPSRYRQTALRMMYQGNYQVSQYIRGQIIVAICVGIMFAIGYAIIGLEYGITLAVLAGILNIIPYLGSFIAVVPALIIGLITSPTMLIKVIIVMMIEQTIEGRFISPQVLGNSLKIHPVTILFILLGAGKLFGVTGVIIGVPVYAVIKVIIGEFYSLYRESSDAYEEVEVDYQQYIEDEALLEAQNQEGSEEKIENEIE